MRRDQRKNYNNPLDKRRIRGERNKSKLKRKLLCGTICKDNSRTYAGRASDRRRTSAPKHRDVSSTCCITITDYSCNIIDILYRSPPMYMLIEAMIAAFLPHCSCFGTCGTHRCYKGGSSAARAQCTRVSRVACAPTWW
ncbi:unnamed protein product [Pieris brassicae]|uniref:Uncharacterized protein n=1 Tax=Pieris brassicae TaxID=7116 RepID=A0A9P0XDW6_PIEBR|nr:unnamed protein product [Pieris brassicae]